MIAHHLDLDPLQLRLAKIFWTRASSYTAGNIPIDCDLKSELKLLAENIGWGKKPGPAKQ